MNDFAVASLTVASKKAIADESAARAGVAELSPSNDHCRGAPTPAVPIPVWDCVAPVDRRLGGSTLRDRLVSRAVNSF